MSLSSNIDETLKNAHQRLEEVIQKAGLFAYKPIQIAEALYNSHAGAFVPIPEDGGVKWSLPRDLKLRLNTPVRTYDGLTKNWRDERSQELLGHTSGSSWQFQNDIWNRAIKPDVLRILAAQNRSPEGQVEAYIYLRLLQRLKPMRVVLNTIERATPEAFDVGGLFQLLSNVQRQVEREDEQNLETPNAEAGTAREEAVKGVEGKLYEVIAYCLFETLTECARLTVTLGVSEGADDLFTQNPGLAALADALYGSKEKRFEPHRAHFYRAGGANAADSGLDMGTNFGPVVQVKHGILDKDKAKKLVNLILGEAGADPIEIIIVCREHTREVGEIFRQRTDWAAHIRGLLTLNDIVNAYNLLLRGPLKDDTAAVLLTNLRNGVKREFPQLVKLPLLIDERGYSTVQRQPPWIIEGE